MKKYALVLCAAIWAFGVGAVATAQGASVPSGAQAAGAGTAGALGNAQAVDETALAIGDQTAAGAQSGLRESGPSNLSYFIRMILVLALVLGVIWLVFRLMKKVGKQKLSGGDAIKVLAQASLGTGKAVHLIGLGQKAWLVGTADSAVSLIAEVEDRELLDELALKAATAEGAPRTDFSSMLQGLLGKKKKPGAMDSSGLEGFDADYLAKQRDRLKKF